MRSRVDRHNYGLIGRGRLWVLPAVEGAIKEDDRTLTLHRGVAHLELRRRLGDRAGGGPKPLGAHAEAAHVEIMVCGPRVPTKVGIMIMKVGNHEAVEIGEVVVDPLLPCLIVGSEVAR
eukprot:scaffold1093_cov148-Isochrysis_galbana.AAC.1